MLSYVGLLKFEASNQPWKTFNKRMHQDKTPDVVIVDQDLTHWAKKSRAVDSYLVLSRVRHRLSIELEIEAELLEFRLALAQLPDKHLHEYYRQVSWPKAISSNR